MHLFFWSDHTPYIFIRLFLIHLSGKFECVLVKLNKIETRFIVQPDKRWADALGIGEGLVTMVVGQTILNNQIARRQYRT